MTQHPLPADLGEGLTDLSPEDLRRRRAAVERLLLAYRSGIDEVATKLRVLQREFRTTHDYNPIENYSTRLKSMPSLIIKAQKRGITSLTDLREQVTDIAGVRVVCSFTSDVYTVRDMLLAQDDLRLRRENDYIAAPKASGYRSVHLVVEVPVYLSSGVEQVPVEIQLRTIAMDFWASLEHKIFYKYEGDVPARLADDLVSAAETSATLDRKMEGLHEEIAMLRSDDDSDPMTDELLRTLRMMTSELREP
ncbi:MAG: GTP pyrophosphokinase family protein [Brachybacterium sp.]|nr:GTP pyrophosphokinase family protein [Brachybacterium sp.]